ncbi:HAD-IA family hydrolase [Streptomyces sp. B29(2018)]|uniref:HAD-IA family hydrolase n=1 Tax=Streptomyces sp. B29(2018) TaxID=2485016 RepID=UPI000FD64309|nr:HAD-IA family hydrolase [Streptomyces sp. B29(2018)]
MSPHDPQPEQPVLCIDMGGVFFSYSFLSALAAWAHAAGTDPDRLRERWQIDGPFDAFERGEITPAEYLGHLRHRLGLHQLSDEQIAAGWNSIYHAVNTELVQHLGRAEVRTRFHRVVGVSNTNALHAGFWRELYREQLPVFHTVHCSHEIGVTKPDPAFFDHVAAEHGVTRSQLVLVDDIAEVIAAANGLGLRAHHYQGAAGFVAFLNTL